MLDMHVVYLPLQFLLSCNLLFMLILAQKEFVIGLLIEGNLGTILRFQI